MTFKRKDTSDGNKKLYCSFCGKEKEEVKKMIAGPTAEICNECVDLCNSIIEEETNPKEINEQKTPILAPFKNEGTVFFTCEVNNSNEKEEIHLTFNRVACLAFSNIFTQLAIFDLDDEYSFDTKELGYEHKGNNFKITVHD